MGVSPSTIVIDSRESVKKKEKTLFGVPDYCNTV